MVALYGNLWYIDPYQSTVEGEMMSETTNSAKHLLDEMEKIKKQYQQYMEISQIYKLPIFQSEPEPQYEPPSIENPLTTNQVTLVK